MQLRLVSLKGAAKGSLAVLLALILLLLALASAYEPLHQAIHKHTDKDGDICAVCMMAMGLLESPVGAAFLAVIILLAVYNLPVFIEHITARSEFTLPPGRAPPVVCIAS